jgi:hypothetical protein
MTYDELYEHIVAYISLPYPVITGDITNWTGKPLEHDKKRACLILGAVMEFLLDCADEGIDPRTLDMTGFVNEKLDELEQIK